MNVEVFTYFVRVAIALALIATPAFRLLDGAATGERYVLLHAWRGLPPVALRNDAG